MSSQSNSAPYPGGFLYTMLRVADLERALEFYQDALGMRELRRETFPDGRFTLVFLGYGTGVNTPMIELTWNWDPQDYEPGTGYGHIALAVHDIYATCAMLRAKGVRILRDPGPMTFAPDETGTREEIAFVQDPDGYRVELIQT